MAKFTISNGNSGLVFGVYEAASADEALEIMAREAGYSSYEELEETAPGKGRVVVEQAEAAEGVEPMQ